MKARLSSFLSLADELGSPARVTMCLPNAVMLCPERADGECPMF
jgi:hypothetical protein